MSLHTNKPEYEAKQLPASPQPSQNRRVRLLVVDDQALNIRVAHQILSTEYDVFMANSGEQALLMCQEEPPDLVLLDVAMPGMDGLEVCRRLKLDSDTEAIPVIFVTAGLSAEDENACWLAGGVDFINKPINPLTLQHRVRAHVQLKLQADALRTMAFADGLTGIANRRHFDDRLKVEWRRGRRNGTTLGLLLVDIDFFKRYNDRYGHQAGDDCLRQVALAMRRELKRAGDLLARYGGEEFVCLLPETDIVGGLVIAALLIDAVHALGIEHQDSDVDSVVTVSVGVGAHLPRRHENSAALVASADAALYCAKKSGRARAHIADNATASGIAPTIHERKT
jgi:diguanylate cyclase (GGDEF)-like protein